jgi:hypothetical protein
VKACKISEIVLKGGVGDENKIIETDEINMRFGLVPFLKFRWFR